MENRRPDYMYVTDFIYVLCKLRVIKRSSINIPADEYDVAGTYASVHEAMSYILTKAYSTSSEDTAFSMLKRFKIR